MAAEPSPVVFDEDNPEWTDLDFARARPATEVLPPEVLAVFGRKRGGRPAGSTKEQVSLRLDKDALASWRASGPGWQSRMNEVLRRASAASDDVLAAARDQGDGARWPALAA